MGVLITAVYFGEVLNLSSNRHQSTKINFYSLTKAKQYRSNQNKF